MTSIFFKTVTKAFRVPKRPIVFQKKKSLPKSALKFEPSVQNHIDAHPYKSASWLQYSFHGNYHYTAKYSPVSDKVFQNFPLLFKYYFQYHIIEKTFSSVNFCGSLILKINKVFLKLLRCNPKVSQLCLRQYLKHGKDFP